MSMRILVADRHPLYREGVARQIMRFHPSAVIAEAPSLAQALAAARCGAPDLFILNYNLLGMSTEAIATMAAEFAGIPILVIADTLLAGEVQEVIRSGARGYLPKTAGADQLIPTVDLILAGCTCVPAEMLPATNAPDATPPWLAALTPRESDILRSVGRGLSNKEIARKLGLAEVTIKLHLSAIFRKMTVRSRTEAAVLAVKAGFL
jgi:DNA-binding NarL/FixJ family response regulator